MRGNLIIISAPSGAGKTSLVRALLAQMPDVRVSVSHTTRPRRPTEVADQDYHFVDAAAFEAMIAEGAFLEHAQVFGNYYGTSEAAVNRLLDQGLDVILEIDCQGAEQVRHLRPDCHSIFILPPSQSVLEQRLRGRGQDEDAVIARRLAAAVQEMSQYAQFDYLVVNEDFETALAELMAIIRALRLRCVVQTERLAGLLQQLLN